MARRWPKHGLWGHFLCQAGSMSTTFLADWPDSRPTKRGRKGLLLCWWHGAMEVASAYTGAWSCGGWSASSQTQCCRSRGHGGCCCCRSKAATATTLGCRARGGKEEGLSSEGRWWGGFHRAVLGRGEARRWCWLVGGTSESREMG